MLNVACFVPCTPLKHPCTDKGSTIPSTNFFCSCIQIVCIECLHTSARHTLGARDSSEQVGGMVPAPTDLWSSREIVNQYFFKNNCVIAIVIRAE